MKNVNIKIRHFVYKNDHKNKNWKKIIEKWIKIFLFFNVFVKKSKWLKLTKIIYELDVNGKMNIKTNKYAIAILEYLRYIQDRIKKKKR